MLQKLSSRKRKAVEKKLRILERERKIAASLQTARAAVHGNPSEKKRLSKTHKKLLRKLSLRDSQLSKRRETALRQKIEQVYRYFKGKNRKTGCPPSFFTGLSPIERHIAVRQAELNFDLLSKHKRFFRYNDIDEEPSGGVPDSELRFFLEAREDKRGISKSEQITEPKIGVRSVAKKELKRQLLKDAEFLKELGDGVKSRGIAKVHELSSSDWYRQSSLSSKEIEALKRMGYVGSSKNVYDFNNNLQSVIAFKQGGFEKESMHHFSKAYFMKEIVPETLIKEKVLGTNKEIDAAIPLPKEKKMAVEFQESHNLGPERVLEKVKPIIEHFDLLIIICAETAKPKYEHVKSKRVHILNNKEFFDFITSFKQEKQSSDGNPSEKP